MSAKNVDTARSEAVSFCNVNIKGATIGDSYSVFLNGALGKSFGGSITEENFTITIPAKNLRKILLEIKSQNGRPKRYEISPDQDSEILLKPSSEIKDTSSGKKFLTNSIREMLEARRREIARQRGLTQEENHLEAEPGKEEKQITNQLQEQVQKKKGEGRKTSFWDKLK